MMYSTETQASMKIKVAGIPAIILPSNIPYSFYFLFWSKQTQGTDKCYRFLITAVASAKPIFLFALHTFSGLRFSFHIFQTLKNKNKFLVF